MTSWKQFSVKTKGRIQIGNTDNKIQQCITGEVSGPLVVSWGNSCAIFELISALAKQQSFKGGNLKKEDKGHFVVRGHATHDCKKSPPPPGHWQTNNWPLAKKILPGNTRIHNFISGASGQYVHCPYICLPYRLRTQSWELVRRAVCTAVRTWNCTSVHRELFRISKRKRRVWEVITE